MTYEESSQLHNTDIHKHKYLLLDYKYLFHYNHSMQNMFEDDIDHQKIPLDKCKALSWYHIVHHCSTYDYKRQSHKHLLNTEEGIHNFPEYCYRDHDDCNRLNKEHRSLEKPSVIHS